jgi:hypothetical protein
MENLPKRKPSKKSELAFNQRAFDVVNDLDQVVGKQRSPLS